MPTPDTIPALTVLEPYATAIMRSQKTWENRPIRTKYRGPLVIHAGKSKRMLPVIPELLRSGLCEPDHLASLRLGCILGVVDLIGCEQYVPGTDRWKDEAWACGPWCLHVVRPRLLPEPVPYKGMLGLWSCPREIVESLLSPPQGACT